MNPLANKNQYALLTKEDPLCGYQEVLSKVATSRYKGFVYNGDKCSLTMIKQTTRESFLECLYLILTHRHKQFLCKNSGGGNIRQGMMT
jgi:hypothetical protein